MALFRPVSRPLQRVRWIPALAAFAAPLAGSAAGTSTVSATTLAQTQPLAGSSAGTATASGQTQTQPLAGTTTGTSAATGTTLSLPHALTGQTAGTSTVTGAIGVGWALTGAVAGTSAASASALRLAHALNGQSAGAATVLGTALRFGTRALAGRADGLAGVAAGLTGDPADYTISPVLVTVYTISPALTAEYVIAPVLATVYTITHVTTPGGQTMATYPYGSTLRVAVNIRAAGVSADPTALTIKTRKPNGLITAYTYAGATVAKDSVGDYHVDVLLDKGGTWLLRGEGIGSNPGAQEIEIDVAETGF